jgi:uncharacterized membrane protein YozB (DUF420 family)
MATTLAGPGFLSARSNLGSDLSITLAVTFTALFIIAGYQGMKGKGLSHHRMILASMCAMFAYFLYYYKIRRLGYISFTDTIDFENSGWMYSTLFKPTLYVHFLMVTLATFFSIYMIITGFRTAVRKDGSTMVLQEGRVAPSPILWGAGLVWFAFLLWVLVAWWPSHHPGMGIVYKFFFLGFGYLIPAGTALLIHKILPEAERRHRVIGKICIALFAGLLVTSSFTYSILYIF